jgi:hypothetical protein
MGCILETRSSSPAFSAARWDRSKLNRSRPSDEHAVSGVKKTEPADTMEDALWKTLA